MDFWQLVEVLGKRKWLILLSAVVAVALTYGATSIVGQKWMATVQFVAPESEASPNAASDDTTDQDTPQDGVAPGATESAVYQAIIKSQDVLKPVIAKDGNGPGIEKLLGNIDFEPVGPRLYELRVTDTNPVHAAELANDLADQFVVAERDIRSRQIQAAVNFLSGQLKQVDANLDSTRNRYQAYRDQHQIVGNAASQIQSDLADFQSAARQRDQEETLMAAAQAQLQASQRQLATIPQATPLSAAGVSPVIGQQLLEQERQKEQIADLLKTHKPNHPLVIQAETALANLTNRINSEFAGLKHSDLGNPQLAALMAQIRVLNIQIAGYQAQINAMDAQVAQAQANINKFKGTDTSLDALTEQLTELQDSRTSLVTRLNTAEMSLDAARRQDPIVILNKVSDFNPPVNTTKGHNEKLMILAALCAMLCTSALIVALNSIDRRVRNVKEAEIALPARLLASIPQPLPATGYASIARITEMQPQSIHAEAYRFLGLHLLNTVKPQVRSLMVLAAKAEQGSTTTLTNLGITLAQAGKRVIVVDANIRTSEIHQVFGVENDFGFTNLLESPDPESLARALRPTANENLHFITSGSVPKNAWQLFRSQNLLELSCRLHDIADYVLYDTPSSLMFTDALNLAPVVDAAILCVRALEPLTGTEERLIELLERANVTVLGSVLSDVPTEVLEGFENYEHYYKPLEAPPYDHYEDGSDHSGNGSGGAAVAVADNIIPTGKTAVLTPSPLQRSKNGNNGGGPAKN